MTDKALDARIGTPDREYTNAYRPPGSMHYAVWLFMHNSLRPRYRIRFRYALSPIMHYDCMHYELFDCIQRPHVQAPPQALERRWTRPADGQRISKSIWIKLRGDVQQRYSRDHKRPEKIRLLYRYDHFYGALTLVTAGMLPRAIDGVA